MAINYAIHPGQILKEHLEAVSMTQKELALSIGVSTTIINEIIKGKRDVNATLATKLQEVFSLSAKYWLNIQSDFDLAKISTEKKRLITGSDLFRKGYSAQSISDRFICYELEKTVADKIFEPTLTNLKLQKLLYFAQKEFIKKGEILFDDKIKRWAYGPVVPTVYNKYKDSNKVITSPSSSDPLDEQSEKLLRSVYNKYDRYTAAYLVNLSHKEKSWINTPQNGTITPEVIRDYL